VIKKYEVGIDIVCQKAGLFPFCRYSTTLWFTATRVLKDGQLIEVDANKEEVRL